MSHETNPISTTNRKKKFFPVIKGKKSDDETIKGTNSTANAETIDIVRSVLFMMIRIYHIQAIFDLFLLVFILLTSIYTP
jgi:hypothetical protein